MNYKKTVSALINLVPAESAYDVPNYVCTWNEQVFLSGDTHPMTRDVLDETHLFGNDGWCNTMAPESVRKDLIFLLDDGWDLPYSYSQSGTSSSYLFELSPDKFPNYGTAPRDRLKKLAEKTESYGWKGLGVWVRVETLTEAFWREKVEWSKYSGIKYWKCDWGNESDNDTFRRMLSRLSDEIYPELVIEHASPTAPFPATNGFSDLTFNYWANRLSYSDVFRTYDVVAQLSIADTLARAGGLYKSAYSDGKAKNLINVEDELYTAAGLGSTFGVMRHPTGYNDIRDDVVFGDARFQNTRPILYMTDEIARVSKWNRVAPAFSASAYEVSLSDESFTDSWNFTGNDTWYSPARNKTMTQKAPAAVTRGLPLPTVTCTSGDKPYVLANRNPNGAICVATVGRTSANDVGYHTNDTAQISLNAGDLTGKIGVFGIYGSLNLTFNQTLTGKTVLAQDLLADSGQDITNQVTIKGNTITIPGTVISHIGSSAKTAGDPSEPGLVLQIGDEEDYAETPLI